MGDLRSMLIRHEGRRRRLYRCTAGKWSIGIGRNLEDVGLSDDEVEYLFANDLRRIRGELLAAFPWVATLDPVRQDALLDMAFMGVGTLRGFTKFLGALQAKDYLTASAEMLQSKWADQVGDRARELAAMIQTGEYQ
ncbi:MAG: glycoside hydrolase family protein [Candidatus Methylomirabilales bacterium]